MPCNISKVVAIEKLAGKDINQLRMLIAKLVRDKMKACERTGHSGCRCASCSALFEELKAKYHINDYIELMTPEEAAMELAARLVFESIYGFISLDHVSKGTWIRSGGHGLRLELLWAKAKPAASNFPFIGAPSTHRVKA